MYTDTGLLFIKFIQFCKMHVREKKLRLSLFFADHYRNIADKYDYFYKEVHQGYIPILMKCLDLKPEHVVADIGSGTGAIAKDLFELSGLHNPIWCVDPSVEMQEVARQKKGVYPILKTAEEFFSNPQISENFDRVLATISAHHFVNPDAVYKGILRSLRPGGFYVQLNTVKVSLPSFKSLKTLSSQCFEREREISSPLLRKIGLNVSLSQEEFSFSLGVKKSKPYERYRCRFISLLQHLSDDQIEEGISELDHEHYQNVKDDELINYECTMLVTKVEKVA